jgi:hypothetical protein
MNKSLNSRTRSKTTRALRVHPETNCDKGRCQNFILSTTTSTIRGRLTTKKEMEHAWRDRKRRSASIIGPPFMTQPRFRTLDAPGRCCFHRTNLGYYRYQLMLDKYAALLIKELQKIDSSRFPVLTLTVEEH